MKRKPNDIKKEDWDSVESPPLTKGMLKRMRPVREAHPDIPHRVRGPQKTPTKQQISIRIDEQVISYFKAYGKNWQTRMNAALKEWIENHQA